jgi:hypothetical protein
MKKLLILVLIALISCTVPARADISPEKRAAIESLLKATGMEKLMNQMIVQMIDTFKAQAPDVPQEFWDKLLQQMDTHELIEKLMPIYDKYYTMDDLKAINAFYTSPVGQKLIANLPQITQESMQIGRQWGEDLGKRVAKQVEDEQKARNAAKSGTDSAK